MRDLWRDEDGLTSVEYALLLAVIVVGGLAAWQSLGDTVANATGDATNSIAAVGG